VVGYDRFHIFCAAITDFDVVPVKKFMVLMIFREVFVQQIQKVFANFRGYVFAVGRVEPNDFSLTVSVLSVIDFVFVGVRVEIKGAIVARIFQRLFVTFCSIFEDFFI